MHGEGFSGSAENLQLKELKLKVSKLKLQFTPKNHYSKSTGNGTGLNKTR